MNAPQESLTYRCSDLGHDQVPASNLLASVKHYPRSMHDVAHYGEGARFFHQVFNFYSSATESEITRWKYESTLEERSVILRREENYELALTQFCNGSISLGDIPNATNVHPKCDVCRKYVNGCPAPGADIGFADGSTQPYPHIMMGSGLNCMVSSTCLDANWLSHLEGTFTNYSKHLTKADLFLNDSCNIPFVETDANGRVLLYMTYRFGMYISFLREHGELTRSSGHQTVMEIGAGWGGFAALVKQLLPHTRYIILDIPSILPLQMSYVHHLGYKIITLRNASCETVKKVLCCSQFDFLFILPHEIGLLPDDAVNLTVNLDSMVEMPLASLKLYLSHIPRISRAFYANNRKGYHNGWPSFRSLVTSMMVKSRTRPWHVEYEERFPSLDSILPAMHKMNDHTMMTGKHVHMFLRKNMTQEQPVRGG